MFARKEALNMKVVTTVLFAGALVAHAAAGGAKEEPVQLRLSSSFATAPATVVVTATVERDVRNRSLIVTADSEEFYTRSAIELDGDQDARLHQFWLKGLPEGRYVITAQVQGTNGVIGMNRMPMNVIGTSTGRKK
jgi:hypothetical protein